MLKIFQSLSGKWNFNRNIIQKKVFDTSHVPTFTFSVTNNSNNNKDDEKQDISTVCGTASFNLITDTNNNNDGDQQTYQYIEEGVLIQADNSKFNISQKYLYRYKDNSITVYFDENPERLFHVLQFTKLQETEPTTPSSPTPSSSSFAKGHHLCINDQYDASYEFISPKEFKLIYSVVGPKKNYKITTIFSKLTTN